MLDQNLRKLDIYFYVSRWIHWHFKLISCKWQIHRKWFWWFNKMVNVRFSILWEFNAVYLQLIEALCEKGMVIWILGNQHLDLRKPRKVIFGGENLPFGWAADPHPLETWICDWHTLWRKEMKTSRILDPRSGRSHSYNGHQAPRKTRPPTSPTSQPSSSSPS